MATILLADDQKSIRDFCKQELEDEGYDVVLARDGQEAIDIVEQATPDLVVLDLRMPRVGGLDAVEAIHALAPGVPVILFTANDEDCLTDRRSRLAAICVEKSEDLSELKLAIRRSLAARKGNKLFRLGLPPL